MRLFLALLVAVPALAQAPAASSAAPPAPAPAKTEETAPSPAPSTDQWLTGTLEVGYRSTTGVGGSLESYRSLIDLGEGPKLLDLDFTIVDPKKRLFDRLVTRGTGWGDDPYTTAHVDADKSGLYNFTFDYRNIAYFNALPSFANPQAPAGIDEQAFDMRRRMYSASLDVFPGKHIIPYLAFDRNSGYGNGVATWLQDASDEFAVPTLLRDGTSNYRGGVRFEYNRFHVTLEEGGTTFKDDDSALASGPNPGDNPTPLFGQTLQLARLFQAYGIRGDSTYTRGLFTATPVSWISLSGQFLYSQPNINVNYTDLAGGNLVLANQLLFYSGEAGLGTGTAEQPHVTGNAGFELRPLKRLRIVESWMTDRYHDAAFGLFSQLFLPAAANSAEVAASTALANQQVVNYNQQQVDAIYDLTSKLTLRGGYRYVWGNTTVLAGQLSQTGNFVSGDLRRNVGLAGFTYKPIQKLSINGDYEGASSDSIYFRTSLNDYQKMRARVRYQATGSLFVQANFTLLNNQNPAPGLNYDFQSRDNALSVTWTPNGAKRVSLTGEYDRSTIYSNIGYLSLPFLTSAISSYRENAHTATSTVDVALPGYAGLTPRLTAGGSMFVGSGNQPSRLFEPLARLSLPLRKNVSLFTEWQWYGVGEAFYLYEGFRTHVFMTGLRLTR